MDNRNCKDNSLANIMLNYIGRINAAAGACAAPDAQFKADGSPVTTLDLKLSQVVEEVQQTHFSDVIFYSEENFKEWGFPVLAVDPLDGTREYIAGLPDWVVSIGLIQNQDFQGEGWIYNPQTGECFANSKLINFCPKDTYQGEVSRSEFSRGLYRDFSNPKFMIKPKGSIAYKLGRLSQGKIDFVVSLTPKNIWDIAGGTLLCHQAGLKFYSQGKLVKTAQPTYAPPLVWCHEELSSELLSFFA